MVRENTGWGYDRIVGAMGNLGHHLSDQTVGNILRLHGIALLRSEVEPLRGRTLFPHTRTFSRVPTSLL
jgi:hypothetical protein